jgi:hypothetical protein
MANLSGQTIQSTYPGLLNLNTATTGITSTPQAITDGLGNDTGLKIATNSLSGPNLFNVFSQYVFDYGGTGFGTGSSASPALSQNRLNFNIFYDTGINSYSAVTVNLGTVSTTTDSVSLSFYTAQYVPNFGIAPKDLILSGITLPTTGSTGVKVVTLGSNLSFSGMGAGYYVCAWVTSNSGVTPTVRYVNRTAPAGSFTGQDVFGYTLNAAGTQVVPVYRAGSNTQTNCVLTSILSSYTPSDITSSFANLNPPVWGFGLNTVR